jgi:hypothetical protein
MTTLKEIGRDFDRVCIAGPQDNREILDFFATISMDTEALQLRYERTPDFFSFIACQGEPSVVHLYRNDDGSIGGITSLTTRYSRVNGRKTAILYAGDLRVSPSISRRTRVQWRRHYAHFVANYRSCAELGCPEYIFTVIMDGNKDALRAFVKPGADPVYRKMFNFQSINILARLPRPLSLLGRRKIPRLPGLSVRWAAAGDREEIVDFLYRENRNKGLGIDFSRQGNGELERRLRYWQDFGIESFLLAREGGKIVGCMAPWSNGDTRRIVIDRAPAAMRAAGTLLPLLGRQRMRAGHELKVLYLSCLEIASAMDRKTRSAILGTMIDVLFAGPRCRNHHLVTFLDSEICPLVSGIQGRGYLFSAKKATLYQVLSPAEDAQKRYIIPDPEQIAGFELATA